MEKPGCGVCNKCGEILQCDECRELSESTGTAGCAVALPAWEKDVIIYHINTAWKELRKNNATIPDDVLDFMREIALWRVDTA